MKAVASRDEILAQLRRALVRWSDVRVAYLFGSLARGSAGATSDIDVAVLVDPKALGHPWPGFELELLTQLCDQLGTDRVDLVLLNAAGPVLAREVLRDGVVICERGTDERIAFELEVLRHYADTRILRDIRNAARRCRQRAASL